MSMFLLVYHYDDDPDWLVAAYATRDAAEADRDRLAEAIRRGCELAGSGPYSHDRPPKVVEVPEGPVDWPALWAGSHIYWANALRAAGEWPGTERPNGRLT